MWVCFLCTAKYLSLLTVSVFSYRPAAANKILIDWLEKVHQNAVLQTVAKL